MKSNFPEGALVVVPVVTPAFAYTMPTCAGLVTEVGGITSHGASVARELGIPTVVGIKGACDILKPGMVISIDGSRGEIRL